jgi:glycine/D-amino acid oxidase-like deaminating enzyme
MNMRLDPSSTGLINAPYWWDKAPPEVLPRAVLPRAADVVVVGAGYTGLHAALVLARAGKNVVVVDREVPGSGASRRNAGFLGRVLKKSFSDLVEKKGLAKAAVMYKELDQAYRSVLEFARTEKIDCHAVVEGRFVGATSPEHHRLLEQELALMERHLNLPFHMISKAEQHSEMATDAYYGGAVIPDLGSIHPGLYHKGMQDRAIEAGVIISAPNEVREIKRNPSGAGNLVITAGGPIAAKDVIVATNGYTTKNLKWFARRIIPFTGYMAATEVLSENLIKKVIPHRRVIIDTDTNIDFFRVAPDSNRVIMGGATASGMSRTEDIHAKLRQIMVGIMPDLAEAQFSHVWSGYCAGTFDMMPHIGGKDGVWYAMGYNFAGVTMGTHMGRKLALRILGDSEGRSAFETDSFPSMPFYNGNSWFMPLVMKAFDWQDAQVAKRGRS